MTLLQAVRWLLDRYAGDCYKPDPCGHCDVVAAIDRASAGVHDEARQQAEKFVEVAHANAVCKEMGRDPDAVEARSAYQRNALDFDWHGLERSIRAALSLLDRERERAEGLRVWNSRLRDEKEEEYQRRKAVEARGDPNAD